MTEWTNTQRETLTAICDCIFPSLPAADDPHGFWARKASDFGIDLAVAGVLDQLPPPVRAGMLGLVDAFAGAGFVALPPAGREQLMHGVAQSSPEAAAGVQALQRITLALSYALPDALGRNPNWPAIGYPGPRRAAPQSEKRIQPLSIDRADQVIDADVCIVGSGAGGGVVAGELARRGLGVVVLEAGGYFNESDFNGLELWANQNLYWRGGHQPTADNTVTMLSGATLGGGTTVNWQNCVRTPAWVREEWAREHGLEGLDGAAFERQLDAVFERIHVTDRCSDLNGPHQRLAEGAARLGYNFKRCFRNVDAAKYDAEVAGYQGWGDITGSRLGTLNTYLEDAYRAGARILVRTRAQRVLTSGGRASGVQAISVGADGVARPVTIRAPRIVVACGALETPALLLRSAIGGPAAGHNFHLHPVVSLPGLYEEDLRAWWGPPQAGICDQFARAEADHGVLLECAHHSMAVPASAFPWQSGRGHKEIMHQLRHFAMFIAIARDRGAGRIEVDANGESVVYYPIRDALDIRNLQRGLRAMAEVHLAAGVKQMVGLSRGTTQIWNPGDDLEAFLADTAGKDGEWPNMQLFSAHQMGSARMGKDRETSVCDPTGELHDAKGVWIGDTSAFPSAVGVNPMITCMALAARTAGFIAG